MKKYFFDLLDISMQNNPKIYIISVGLGWPRTDEFSKKYPDRYIQTEASEQTALDIAVGLSYSGMIPVIYTITPFYLRGWETIRTYLNHEKLPCVLIGAGVMEEYGEHDGFSHSASDIARHFDLMENFKKFYPDTKGELLNNIQEAITNGKPNFINIHRN